VANALRLKFSRYEDAERFFLDAAEAAGLSGWELDRLLSEIERHSRNNPRVVVCPSPRGRRGCKA
jgi:hypothetical protein